MSKKESKLAFQLFKTKKKNHHDANSVLPEHVFLKLFKDIPKSEIPMVFPGAKVRLNRIDQSMISYPIVTGIGLVFYNVIISFLRRIAAIFCCLIFLILIPV